MAATDLVEELLEAVGHHELGLKEASKVRNEKQGNKQKIKSKVSGRSKRFFQGQLQTTKRDKRERRGGREGVCV